MTPTLLATFASAFGRLGPTASWHRWRTIAGGGIFRGRRHCVSLTRGHRPNLLGRPEIESSLASETANFQPNPPNLL
ncbi:MAG TPA: hypothetical protein DDX19_20790 [Rhodopirellula baltica]|uniref:Uncharacterized protein n=1 Tax=Rhodopirellula baltica (strain DSM 10527 / NCIMB 13988 / SH1) TaxID=243090 RepID=Q7UNV5_RHOBA|nr:hypothetical protein RB7319 [Rhodopirellula baltica SH 1]HBE65145.1 hypothetical protein [Rhodopirellula baltica]